MKNGRALERVDNDLAQGHTYVAIQRLTTLVHNDPHDLHVRSRLASVHLATGNLIEAGRWGYVTEDMAAEAVAAFERSHPHPRARWELLKWTPGVVKLGPHGAARIATLSAARDAQPKPPDTVSMFRDGDGGFDLVGAGCALLATAVGGAVVICLAVGLTTILRAWF